MDQKYTKRDQRDDVLLSSKPGNRGESELQPFENSDGKTGEEYSNSWYCMALIMLHVVVSGATVGIPLTILNPITPVLHKMYNETYMNRYEEPIYNSTWLALLSLTMSMIFVGAFASSFVLKFLMSKLTRRKVLIVLHVTNIVGHGIMAIGGRAWGSYEAIILGRFIGGVAIGAGMGLTGIIVSELTVPHRCLFYNSFLGAFYPAGVMFGAIIGWQKVLGSEELWVFAVMFTSLISMVYLVAAYWIPETPYQTMLISGSDITMKLLGKLRVGSKEEMSKELQSMNKGSDDKSKSAQNVDEATFSEVIKTPQYRKHFIGCVVVFLYLQLSGIPNILFFSDQIFIAAGLSADAVTPATIGVLAVGPVISFAAVGAMKIFDPRIILLFGSVVMILGDAFMVASLATYKEVPAMSIGCIVAMATIFFGFSFINSASYGLISVLCIDRTRAACMFMVTLVFWFFGWLVGFVSPYFAEWMGPYAFIVWMVLTIAITVYVAIFVPHTKGKTEDEIQEFYK